MAQQYPHAVRGAMFALVGGVFWGFSANCAEILMGEFGVSAQWLTCVRMACSAAFMLLVILVSQRDRLKALVRDRNAFVRTVLFALVGVVMVQFTYLEAIRLTGAGVALLLQQLGLLLIMLYTCVTSRRLPLKREVVAVVFALVGVVLISTQGDLTSLSIPLAGLIWGLLAAVALGFYNIVPMYPLARYGSLVTVGLAMFFGSLFGLVIFRPWQYEVSLPPEGLLVLGGVVVVGTIAAYLLYMQGVKETGPMRASLIGCVEPVSGMIIAAIWQHTPVSVFDVLGAASIVLMICLVTEREPKEVSQDV